MPIDVDKVVGAQIPGDVAEWDEDAVILYHLGVGAGVPPTDAGELQYTYESAPLKVLPSFGVVPVFRMLGGLVGLEGLTFNPMMLLHGEQDLVLHKPLPARAKVENTGRVSDVYDKGKGALVVVETETKDESGALLCTNRFSAFIRGEGGFGGESGPAPGNEAPARDPDHVAESTTLPQQALLYRLSGDKNPLHVDPNMAALGGFDRPILHGLCSFGIAGRALIKLACGSDPTRLKRMQLRFSAPVFPGETIRTEIWRDGAQVSFRARVVERDLVILNNGLAQIA